MNRYEVRYHQSPGSVGYVIYRDSSPLIGGEHKTRRAAMREAELELKKLQRSESAIAA